MTFTLLQNDISIIAKTVSMEPSGLFKLSRDAQQEIVDDINGLLVSHSEALTRQHRIYLLRDLLYRAFYLNLQAVADKEADPSLIENRWSSGNQSESFQAIDNANVGVGYMDPGWEVFSIDSTDNLVGVIKEELKIWLDPNEHLLDDGKDIGVRKRVAIKMPKNLINQGTYVAVGNVGPAKSVTQSSDEPLVNIYLNFVADAAADIMQFWTQKLNTLGIPFSLSMLDSPKEYHRQDPGILAIRKRDWRLLPPVINQYGAQFCSVIRPEIPILTKPLLQGVSVAEAPEGSFLSDNDFHLNRFLTIAEALFVCWELDLSESKLLRSLQKTLNRAGVDAQKPYLNPKTRDYFHL